KWSVDGGSGYGLGIDEAGRLALWIADGSGELSSVHSGTPLGSSYPRSDPPGYGITTLPPRSTTWTFVAATYDAQSGTVTLYQQPLSHWPGDTSRAVVERTSPVRDISHTDAPLLIAAGWDRWTDDQPQPGTFFNGKIDSPRLFDRALDAAEIESLRRGATPERPMAAWDFAANMSSQRVSDISSNSLHGSTVNMPTRAVTDHTWTGAESDFKRASEQYAAIHFHDDDLDDARWSVAFEYTVPDDLRSGIYGARLRAGGAEDTVPFFVRPRSGTSNADIAFLVPTFSYLAYANSFDDETPELLSHYDHHSDGSGVAYSSWLRPILDVRPNIGSNNPWEFIADTHLVDWLEAKEFAYDTITDDALHAEGHELIDPYRVVVTGSHPEYYSSQMLDALEEYLQAGGRLMYMGGNGFYWIYSLHPERPLTAELRRWGGTQYWEAQPGEYYHSTTGELGGLWRNRGRAPQRLVGVGFTAQGFDVNSTYRRLPDSFDPRAAFIFEGIGDDEVIGDIPSLVLRHGAAGSELDRFDHFLGTPPHALLLATSAGGHSDAYQHVVEEVQTSNQGNWDEMVRADMVYFEYPNDGAVWTPASIAWSGSLSYNDYDNNVSRITENVLRRFAEE
ncbi:MAG TPA: LamG domain-containing protein, partial [Acidobacteriota bacterium]|nr:LamG domain-containing protein [Acidobacteriota bacterium]